MMKRGLRLIGYPRRQWLFRVMPPLIFTYVILLPAQLSLLPSADLSQASRTWFTLAQIFLPVGVLWPLLIYFLPVYQADCRETLQSLHHPDGICVLLLLLEHQLRTLPLYIIYLLRMPEYSEMVLLLVLQSVCIALVFWLILTLCRSAVIAMAVLLVYLSLCIAMENIHYPVLIQINCLWDELPSGYLQVRIISIGVEYMLIKVLKFSPHRIKIKIGQAARRY